jgi:hypothetical protein
MKHFYKAFLLIILLPLFSLAQGNYQPGLVVNLKGDTSHGFINYGEWESMPKNIYFKTDPNNPPVKLSADKIKYFSVSVGYLSEYQSYKGHLTTDKTEINHLYVGRDTSFRIDTVFLKIIQKGKNIVLFSYSDNIKTRYFISKNLDDQPEELIYRIYFNSEDENGRDRTSYERTFMKQLSAVAAKLNDATLNEMIIKADYSETDLINIAGRINGISDKELLKKSASHHTPLKFILFTIAFLIIYFTVHLKSTF